MQLNGLHHVTAVTGNAQGNLDFYTDVLGLRFVKQTVNQDDVSAYHLFYADGEANAGTEVTFFDWPTAGPNVSGNGTVAEIGLRVPGEDALTWWQQRLDEKGVQHSGPQTHAGRTMLHFADPEGQRLAIVADTGPGDGAGVVWEKSTVPEEYQIRGLNHVVLQVADMRTTEAMLRMVMGFERRDEYQLDTGTVTVFDTGAGSFGSEVHVLESPDASHGRVGIGGVHHVAFRVDDLEALKEWRDHILSFRVGITDVIDRFYFQSLYFREPNRILYEIATDGPGFAVDEDAATLGQRLALPPFLEPRRDEIEAGLTPLDVSKLA